MKGGGSEMLSDKQLVEMYRSGHQESLTCLIEVYRNDLYKFCRRLTLNAQDAEDLIQEMGKLINPSGVRT